MTKDMTQMNVIIAGRVYPLKIQNGEESAVREAVETVNNKLQELRASYEGRDMQDYMAMLLANFAVEQVKKRDRNALEQSELEQKLNELEAVLSF